jgi:hypothetical protein
MIPIGYQLLVWLVLCLAFGSFWASLKAKYPAQFVTWLLYQVGIPFLIGVALRLAIG